MALEKRRAEKTHLFPRTLSESIYNYLKEAIFRNDLKANQPINEKQIAEQFGVSMTPVREAVLRLGAEGFVTINSHREAVVREISFREIKEIFQVMAVLDSLGSSLAVDSMSQEDIEEIERLTREMEVKCRQGSIEAYMALNLDVHKKIWEHIPNAFLQSTLLQANDQMLRYNYARSHAFRKPGVLERSMEEHRLILETLKARNKERLSSLILRHWGSVLQPSPFEEGLKEYLSNEGKEVRKEKRIKIEGKRGEASGSPDASGTGI